jgi:hypothetical protein
MGDVIVIYIYICILFVFLYFDIYVTLIVITMKSDTFFDLLSFNKLDIYAKIIGYSIKRIKKTPI